MHVTLFGPEEDFRNSFHLVQASCLGSGKRKALWRRSTGSLEHFHTAEWEDARSTYLYSHGIL